ncbi:AI-2E family transporter [Luteimonas sp. RD2P54]|uniref:AI-2E family transporter n=1 Tax=Luteimonas endophytica TaxID=3042023 RepID=A0ABT6JDN7_9GAMM|nr:AI-2E family transporter [Luteimonas endophytica]MDH5824934.1 AI-2E family transporter [Luteimonas endophytica]
MSAPLAAAKHDDAPPPPPRPRAPVSVVVLAALAFGYTLWAAQGVVVPVLLAMFFALVGNPILRALRRVWIPRFVGALLVLALGLTATVLLGRQLVVPASEWMQQVPRELQVLTPKLKEMAAPMQRANEAARTFAEATDGSGTHRVQMVTIRENDPWKRLSATPRLLASVLAVVLLTFFFMVYGESLQRHAIALLPHRHQKRLTVGILQSIEMEISRYVLTITVINMLLGAALAGVLVWLGIAPQEALLWGTIVALLNYAPYVGPAIGAVLMLLMGFVTWNEVGPSLLPVIIYVALQTLEGQLLTPIILGRRMALSPLILILALMLFGFLWGILGLLLAVPLLACAKLVLTRIEGLEGWARLLE